MSKRTYPKENNEIERLEQMIRELKSENRHLHKELKKSNKKYKPEYVLMDEDSLSSSPLTPVKPKCTHCSRGEITQTDLGVRILEHCTVCDKRRTLKKK